ncbi:MAG: 5'-3' exonuclease [Ruminococcaceae bacterium]|nr:5'-3' exonuclease [Oscillospiraceae bacterium]
MPHLLLIDGHNLLFKMFYGMPEIRGRNGMKVQAVVGFASAMRKVVSLCRPSHMLVLFDSEECGDRRQMCPDYKANRPDYSAMEPDDCPFTQLPYIYKLLENMEIPHAEIHGCEADDVIASYALRCSADGWTVLIMSTDKDYYQLIRENVTVMLYRGFDSAFVTPETVYQKYGVYPDRFADHKCLVGDKSDNISGVPGIGNKRAADLLHTYGSLDGIIAHAAEVTPAKIRESLLASGELLVRNRQLILLDDSAPLPFEAETLISPRFVTGGQALLEEIGVF